MCFCLKYISQLVSAKTAFVHCPPLVHVETLFQVHVSYSWSQGDCCLMLLSVTRSRPGLSSGIFPVTHIVTFIVFPYATVKSVPFAGWQPVRTFLPNFSSKTLVQGTFLLILSLFGALFRGQDTGPFYDQVIPKHKGTSPLKSHGYSVLSDYFPLLGFAVSPQGS